MDVLEERKTLIRQLQTQLRNEEMSLVLLKKIRQSQVLAEQAKEASKVSIQPAVGQSSHQQRSSHQNSNQQQQQNQHGHRGTPPLNSSNSKAGRLGSSTQPNASGKQPGVKSVLTPDLSHLKPVSVVSYFKVSYHNNCIIKWVLNTTLILPMHKHDDTIHIYTATCLL